MDFNYVGWYKCFLFFLYWVCIYFECVFGGNVMFYDVYSFGFIFEEVDSCKSICYFVVV